VDDSGEQVGEPERLASRLSKFHPREEFPGRVNISTRSLVLRAFDSEHR
jgi:hypothetical protein